MNPRRRATARPTIALLLALPLALAPAAAAPPSARAGDDDDGPAVAGDGHEIERFAKELRAADAEHRLAAARGLADLGSGALPAASELAAALFDEDAAVADAAADALGAAGPGALEAVARVLDEGRKDGGRVRAARVIGSWGERGAPGVDVLRRALSNGEDPLRVAALGALARVGPASKDALFEIARVLLDPNEEVRAGATEALGRIGKPAVRLLKVGLADRDKRVRWSAAVALGVMGADAAEATSDLIRVLDGDDEAIRDRAIAALAAIGAPAVKELGVALRAEAARIRSGAALALGGMREAGTPAVTRLSEALGDDNPAVRSAAEWALERMGAASVDALRGALADAKSPPRRQLAASTLGRLGEPAKAAIEPIAAAVDDPALPVRKAAVGAIAALHPDAKVAVPALVRAMHTAPAEDDEDPAAPARAAEVRQEASLALATYGEEAVDALAVVLVDAPPIVRALAARTLGLIGPGARPALPALLRAAADDAEGAVRGEAAKAVGLIDPEARSEVEPGGARIDPGH